MSAQKPAQRKRERSESRPLLRLSPPSPCPGGSGWAGLRPAPRCAVRPGRTVESWRGALCSRRWGRASGPASQRGGGGGGGGMAGPGAAEPPPDLYRDTWVRYLGECSAKGRPGSPGLTRCPPCAALLPSPAGGKAAGRARREQHSQCFPTGAIGGLKPPRATATPSRAPRGRPLPRSAPGGSRGARARPGSERKGRS